MFALLFLLSEIKDSRTNPQIKTIVIAKSILAMMLARLGSLNAFEQLAKCRKLKKFLKANLPSADTLGRVCALFDSDTIRAVNRQVYTRVKRNKAIKPFWHGLIGLAIDGHESHATFRRCCKGCLERKVGDKKRTQYYHRNVTAQLVADGLCIMLDAEPQLPGEGEVATAIRLLTRVLKKYSRAFDVVLADAIYATSTFFNFVIEHKKDAIVVLKENCPELLADATRFFAGKQPTCSFESKGRKIDCWDGSGFQSGPSISKPIRVVKSEETWAVKRQLNGQIEEQTTTWYWLTTLSPIRASTEAMVQLGHSRWCIENKGFNELVTRWFSDHVYMHDPNAILNFWLMSLLAYNLFSVFFLCNLKEALRKGKSMLHFARQIQSELYAGLVRYSGVPP